MAEAEALIFRHLLQTDGNQHRVRAGLLLRTLQKQHGLALNAPAPFRS
jgi:hypothetical protein